MKKYKEVILEISKNCNLNCIMCGYGAKFNKPDKFMDYALFDCVLKQLEGDFEVIRLNGRGESTIHPEFVKFITHARELYPEGRIRLFSNMNYRNDAITTALSECLCETMMSLDSVNKQNLERIRQGTSYETVMHNIERLCNSSRLTAIVFTLQPDNFYELVDVARFAYEHNCHFFCNAVRNVWMEEEFTKLVNANTDFLKESYIKINQLYAGSDISVHLPGQVSGVTLSTPIAQATCADLSRCPNVGKDICVYYDGTVTPCGMFNPYVLGNLKEQSLSEIITGSKLCEFIKSQSEDPYCKNCQYICD